MGYLNSLLKNIFRGTSEGDGTGTGARDAGKIINDNKDLIDGALEEINNASEKVVNKATNLDNPNNVNYTTTQTVKNAMDAVQAANQQYTADQLANYQAKSEKGQANGYAGLDANGLVPTANLPAYVEEIIEGTYLNSTTFNDGLGDPVTPTTNKLYVDTNDSKVYRWGGSVFTEIVASPGTTDQIPEGTVNKYFTESRVLATILAGYQTLTGAAVNAADSILSAIGKLQGQINTLTSSLGSKMEKGTYTGTGEDLKNLIDQKETPLGAQSKADSAYNAAVDYANNLLKQGIAQRYADIATMIADQANQEDKGIYLVVDASGDATVDSGYAYYEYKGTTVGDLTDYRKLNEEESQDVDHSVFALDADVVKSVSVNGGTPVTPDPSGHVDLTVAAGSYTPPSDYNTVAAMLADQANQTENVEYTVKDASGWSTITHSGWATFKKKATSTASENDYDLREQEDFDTGTGEIGQRVYSTSSSSGAVDDADISLGSTSFGTDSTTQLQALLDEALNGPMTIVWDGRYSVSATLKVHANTRIIARPGCGVILRNASNCYVLENANIAKPSVTGGWNSNIVDENIIIENLIVNGNGYNTGTGGNTVFDTANNGSATNGSAQTKRNQIINFIGVRNLTLENVQLLGGRYWAAHFANIEYGFLNRVYIDFGESSNRDDYNYDGLHLKGGVNHFKIKDITIKNAKDDNIALNSHSQLEIYTDERGPITNVEMDGVTVDSRTMGIGIYSETYRVDNIRIKKYKGTTKSHAIRITNGEYPSPDGDGNIGSIMVDDMDVNVLPGSPLAAFGGLIQVRCNVEKLVLNNLVRTDFSLDEPYIELTDDESLIKSLIISNVQQETTGGTWANSFLKLTNGLIEKCLIANVTHIEETSFINAPIVEVAGGDITDLVLSNIETEKVNRILNNPTGIIGSIKAVNIGHPGSGNASFETAGTVAEFHLSNYIGNTAIFGSFTKRLGSYFDYLGEKVRASLPDVSLFKGSQIVVTDDDVVGYVRAFSNGTDWIRVTDGGAVTPIIVNILLSEDFSGTTVNTSSGTISNPDSVNILVEQNDGILFTRQTDNVVSGSLDNGWNSVNSYAKGSVIAVDLNQVTGSWRGVFSIRWIFNGTSDFISVQGDALGNVRIAIKEANVLVYDYTTSGLSIYQRFKIDYTTGNVIKIYYYNAGWVEIDSATTKNYNLGTSGTLTLSSASNDVADDVGEQIKYNRLRITDANYATELP